MLIVCVRAYPAWHYKLGWPEKTYGSGQRFSHSVFSYYAPEFLFDT